VGFDKIPDGGYGHLGIMALSRVTLSSAGLSCVIGYGLGAGKNWQFLVAHRPQRTYCGDWSFAVLVLRGGW